MFWGGTAETYRLSGDETAPSPMALTSDWRRLAMILDMWELNEVHSPGSTEGSVVREAVGQGNTRYLGGHS